jgi:hypothetical protein
MICFWFLSLPTTTDADDDEEEDANAKEMNKPDPNPTLVSPSPFTSIVKGELFALRARLWLCAFVVSTRRGQRAPRISARECV